FTSFMLPASPLQPIDLDTDLFYPIRRTSIDRHADGAFITTGQYFYIPPIICSAAAYGSSSPRLTAMAKSPSPACPLSGNSARSFARAMFSISRLDRATRRAVPAPDADW